MMPPHTTPPSDVSQPQPSAPTIPQKAAASSIYDLDEVLDRFEPVKASTIESWVKSDLGPVRKVAETPATPSAPSAPRLQQPSPEPAPQPEPQPEPQPDPLAKHSKRAIARGRQYGLSDAQMAGASPQELNDWLLENQEYRERAAYEHARSQSVYQASQMRQPPPAPEPALEETKDPFEGYPDEFVQYRDMTQKELKALREEMASLKAEREQERAHSVVSRLEDGFASLGEKFGHIFGTGRSDSLAANSRELLFRKQLIRALADWGHDPSRVGRQEMEQMADYMFSSFLQPKPIPSLPKAPEPEPKPRSVRDPQGRFQSVEDMAEAAVARPTNRGGGPEPKGDLAAARQIARYFTEHGMTLEQELEEEKKIKNGFLK